MTASVSRYLVICVACFRLYYRFLILYSYQFIIG